MKFQKDKIILDKIVNNLDRFALDFVKILEKKADYVLVSGYVSILFGRSRISEDIDMFIPRMEKTEFSALHNSLLKDFWCLNGDDAEELFDLLMKRHSIRYARKGKVIPNIEVKFACKPSDFESLSKKIRVEIGKKALFVSPIELQIAYKERILKSEKDRDDALHLREVFKDNISKKKIKYYEELVMKHD
ncbi:hypothetical protein HYU09_01600 [Candidatus Woesearchaeota archaeon]|nr:hypothetical protein [Candidatus Woesearchaeota archaeon]